MTTKTFWEQTFFWHLGVQAAEDAGRLRCPKDYAADCEVIVLCCLYPGARGPDLYLLSSTRLAGTVQITAGVSHLTALEDWSLLTVPSPLPLLPVLPLSA